MIEPESRLRRRDRVLVQSAADQRILLDLDGGQYYALDEVSGKVWELCDGSRDVAAVIAAVCQDYDAPPEVIEEDVRAFLEELVHEKLVVAQA
jgi:coenzyme PQQ biosynthesis protein PqqD